MTTDEIECLLREAIERLITRDYRLLSLHFGAEQAIGATSELSIAFSLGWHLKVLVGSAWDVDGEYNRVGFGADMASKTRSDDQRKVRPDLIVHHRGLSGPEHNLLVLELKKDDSTQTHTGGSLESARAVQETYCYQHAVLLDLGISRAGSLKPVWEWSDGSGGRIDVFDGGALDDLLRQGRAREADRYADAGPSSTLAQESQR